MALRKKTWSYGPAKSKKINPEASEELIEYLQEKGDEIDDIEKYVHMYS